MSYIKRSPCSRQVLTNSTGDRSLTCPFKGYNFEMINSEFIKHRKPLKLSHTLSNRNVLHTFVLCHNLLFLYYLYL